MSRKHIGELYQKFTNQSSLLCRQTLATLLEQPTLMFWQLGLCCSLFLLLARLLRTCCRWLHLHSVHDITVYLRGLNSFHWLHHSIHLYRSSHFLFPAQWHKLLAEVDDANLHGPFSLNQHRDCKYWRWVSGFQHKWCISPVFQHRFNNFIVFRGTEVFLCNNTLLTFISWPSPFCFMVACTRSPFPSSRMLFSKWILHFTDLRKSMPMMKSSPMSASTTSQKYFCPSSWKPKCCTMPPSIHESIWALRSCTRSTGSSHPNSWLSLRLMRVTCAAVSTTAIIFRRPTHTGTTIVSAWFDDQLNCRTCGCTFSTWAPPASETEVGSRHRSASWADVASVAASPSSLTASVVTTICCCSWSNCTTSSSCAALCAEAKSSLSSVVGNINCRTSVRLTSCSPTSSSWPVSPGCVGTVWRPLRPPLPSLNAFHPCRVLGLWTAPQLSQA